MLKKVLRNSPRAVLTYIYTPFPDSKELNQSRQTIYDFHICLDHLWEMSEGDRNPKSKAKKHILGQPSHEFNILKAARFRNENGDYIIREHVFSKKYDFVGKNNPYRDRLAIAIISSVVNQVNDRKLESIDWNDEINIARRIYMGKHYHEGLEDRLERERRQKEWNKEDPK